MASTGDSKDFGDLSVVRANIGALANPTRGLFAGGYTPTQLNTMDFVTLATTGNAEDWGDLTICVGTNSANTGSPTRGIVWGGYDSVYDGKSIDYFTWATKGNSTHFGESDIELNYRNCTSDSVRAIAGGGQDGPSDRNIIDYITIATTGKAVEFGDLNTDQHHAAAAYGTNHGGL